MKPDEAREASDSYGTVLAWGPNAWEKVALAASQLFIGKHYGAPLTEIQDELASIIYDLAQQNIPEDSPIRNPKWTRPESA